MGRIFKPSRGILFVVYLCDMLFTAYAGVLRHSEDTYGTAFNRDNPFIYPVPFTVHLLLDTPFFNRTHDVFNEPHGNESRIKIGDYHYYVSEECGIHFINQGEGFIINSETFEREDESDRCTWGFVGNRFCTPNMECTEFAAKKKNDCKTSYLQVTDGGDTFVNHYCDANTTPLVKNLTAARGILDVTYRYTGGKNVAFNCLVRCVPYEANYTSAGPAVQGPVREELPKRDRTPRQIFNFPPANNSAQCRCGEPNGYKRRIVGGRETSVSQYPWMVGIMNRGRRLPFCGGSLINDRYVLTAAHCMEDETLDDLIVVLNEHDFERQNETYGMTIRAKVAEIIPYQYYLESTFYGDIALLRLETPVNITNFALTPLCLPMEETQSYAGKDVIGAGWGTLKEQGNKSTTLQEVIMRVYENSACNDYHTVDVRFPPQVMENMLCAGYSEGGRDTCAGDSGGPLFTWEHRDKRFHQIGVTSWGFGCGNRLNPGVFTRMSSFLYWIQANTLDATWCGI